MININLLPKFQTTSVKWIIFALMIVFIIFLLHMRCKIILEEKQEKIALLKQEIQTLDAEIANFPSENLTLMSNSKQALSFFAWLKKISDTIPVGLYLIELSMVKNSLRITGYAEKTALIEAWVNTLNATHSAVSLKEMIRNKETEDLSVKFCLWIKL